MAKIKTINRAIVVNSEVKYDDYKLVAKYRPEALTLKGGEDGKEPIFTVCVRNGGPGCIDENGAIFGEATRDDAKLATITMMFTGDADADIKEYIVDELGGALMKLNKVEAGLPAVIEAIKAERETVRDSIEVAQ